LIETGQYKNAEGLLAGYEQKDPFDWRILWYRGISAMAQGQVQDAVAFMDRVYSEMPGELAPKLALAFAWETAGDFSKAVKLFDIVSRTDPNLTSAAFGLARCLGKLGNKSAVIAAYKRIPAESIHFTQAQIALTRTLIESGPDHNDLALASQTLGSLSIEGLDKHYLSAQVLQATVRQLKALTSTGAGSLTILGEPLHEPSLRKAVERELRACAQFVKTHEAKMALIDWANRERPVTLV
jgi:serine/threonine-protein kinase PknG